MPVRAIAFDLDDTLTDWWTGIERAAAVARDPGILDRTREQTWLERDGIVVNRHHWKLQHMAHEFTTPDRVEAFVAALDPPLFDDVAPALDALAPLVRLALLTNNPNGVTVLERHGLHTDVFDCVVVADPAFRKPHPRAFAPLVEQLGLKPHEIAYVGDSYDADLEGAHAFGLQAIWIDRWDDGHSVPDGARRITSLHDLAALVQK